MKQFLQNSNCESQKKIGASRFILKIVLPCHAPRIEWNENLLQKKKKKKKKKKTSNVFNSNKINLIFCDCYLILNETPNHNQNQRQRQRQRQRKERRSQKDENHAVHYSVWVVIHVAVNAGKCNICQTSSKIDSQ